MNSQPGRHQYIEHGKTDALTIRLIDDDQTELTLSGTQQVQILAQGGGELVAITSTGVTGSGSVATYSREWAAATFSRDHGYRAVWTLATAAATYLRTQYFSIVRRAFRSQLTDADITSLHPYITNQNQQANLSLYRLEAWEEIQRVVQARIPRSRRRGVGDVRSSDDNVDRRIDDYAGNFFNPDDFRQAHLLLTLAWFFEHNSFGNADQNELRAERMRSRALAALDLALSTVAFDRDDDALQDGWEEHFSFNSIPIER